MKAAELAERAGYLSACNLLTVGQFQQVGELEKRVKQLGGRSARLLNPRLQVEYDPSRELALTGREHLPAYDYQLNGRNPT